MKISFISCNIQDNFKTNFPNNDFDKNLAGKAPIYSPKNIGLNIRKKILLLLSYPKNYIDTQYNQTPNIDVFYIHPTLYTSGNRWNADINNKKLNQKIKNTAIKYQASVFAGIANIYTPHYRQMHIHSYSDLKMAIKHMI